MPEHVLQDARAPAELVAEAAMALSAGGIEAAQFEAKVILAHLLHTKPAHVTLERTPVRPEIASRYRQLVTERAGRVPLQYLLGTHEFMDLTLKCRPGVFIPRPETELLVETALDLLKAHHGRLVAADIGCGNGAIAIAMAHHLPQAIVHAVDISADALRLAAENARQLSVADRVRFHEGDLLAPLIAAGAVVELDTIVANLPYVPSGEISGLAPEISVHEPRATLDGGPDGLAYIRKLVHQMGSLPARERLGALEVGVGQAKAVEDMLRSHLDCAETLIRRDYAGIERVVVARLL